MANATLTAARAAGWSSADLCWEQTQEAAARRCIAGDAAAAARRWRRALRLARRHFPADDPRLACALANAARAQLPPDAAQLRAAQALWRRSALWVDGISLPQRARSSVHHFRMEQRHRGVYQTHARRALHEAAAQARALLDGEMQRSTAQQLAQWKVSKPPSFDDSRKLLAACLLLAGNVGEEGDG